MTCHFCFTLMCFHFSELFFLKNLQPSKPLAPAKQKVGCYNKCKVLFWKTDGPLSPLYEELFLEITYRDNKL
jgi:hypothetical protein